MLARGAHLPTPTRRRASPDTSASSHKLAGLLPRLNRLRFLWVVMQGGRDAFNRDWSYCCSWAFARWHGADRIGAGERRSHQSSRGRVGFRDPGALLVHVARLAWLLPALALLVMAAQTAGC